jgi:hypothetical protein
LAKILGQPCLFQIHPNFYNWILTAGPVAGARLEVVLKGRPKHSQDTERTWWHCYTRRPEPEGGEGGGWLGEAAAAWAAAWRAGALRGDPLRSALPLQLLAAAAPEGPLLAILPTSWDIDVAALTARQIK